MLSCLPILRGYTTDSTFSHGFTLRDMLRRKLPVGFEQNADTQQDHCNQNNTYRNNYFQHLCKGIFFIFCNQKSIEDEKIFFKNVSYVRNIFKRYSNNFSLGEFVYFYTLFAGI